ncbi:MAG: PD-(D/E)XK nuclease family protein [Bifidobacteriaceae bacterium]|jgi:superfamily I DNA/RNA helicase/RecB family exonuclease|nr:PD-(D/E)XK nuclease family protein [Bifidobacteriaceae bacterium]
METSRLALRLDVTPPPVPEVEPDQSQAGVLRMIERGESVSVFGFPGTGKTLVAELAVARALAAGLDGRRLVVLSADRHGAAELSARIVRRVGSVVAGRPAVTPTSLAMTILQARAEAVAGSGLDGALEASREYQPQMVTGAEQSAALAALLEADAEGVGPGVGWPPSVPPEARRLTAFRDELRDLLMRAAERGLDAVDLARLGQDRGRPDWVAAAHFYQRYLDTLDLRNTADAGLKLDAAAMVAQAHLCLRDWDRPLSVRGQSVELDLAGRPGWELVIVDDYQEASLALHRLVGQLAAQGSQVVCLGSPDTAAQSFRGALPGQLVASTGPAPDGWEALEAVLGRCWRQSGELHAKAVEVVARLRPAGRSRAAVVPPAPASAPKGPSAQSKSGLVRAAAVGSAAEAAAVIARRLREAHAVDGLAFSSMAVLTRTAGQVALMRSLLTGAGVPVRVPGSEVLATDHPAVAPLVTLMRWTARGASLPPDAAASLLVSSVGGMDAADLRELRRALSREGRAEGVAGPPDVLAARLLDGGTGEVQGFAPAEALGRSVPARLAPAVERLRSALRAGRQAAARSGAGAADVLWAIWEASGLGELWSGWALAGGPRGSRADANLDAVLALFAAASRHDARKPGSGSAGFAAYLEAQQLPSDTIAAQAPPGDRVTVSTATAAIGREWDLVALVGLEEDVWPDLRLRDTLLGAGRLADIVDGKDVPAAGPERRREVLEEETRSFALALTRAKREVLAVAVANTDEQPSRFFYWLAGEAASEAAGAATAGGSGGQSAAGRCWPFDLRGIVAEGRARLACPPPTGHGGGGHLEARSCGNGDAETGGAGRTEAAVGSAAVWGAGGSGAAGLGVAAAGTGVAAAGGGTASAAVWEAGGAGSAGLGVAADHSGASGGDAAGAACGDAARVLAVLAAVGADGADPAEWPGVLGRSAADGLHDGRSAPVLSPSKVEALSKCPLLWALEKAGGTRQAGDRATLGTLIHWLAEEYPHDGPGELKRRLREHWSELGLEDSYSSRRLLEEALQMAERLGIYQESHPNLVASEAEIKLPEPGPALANGTQLPVRLAGRIDRLEGEGPDRVRVVDFKTGKNVPSAADAELNPQLGAYQVAVNAGLVPPHRSASEAVLVYLSSGASRPAERRQPALAADGGANWMIDLLSQCAKNAQGPTFEARPGPQCRNCSVKTSCPAWPEGKQVVA